MESYEDLDPELIEDPIVFFCWLETMVSKMRGNGLVVKNKEKVKMMTNLICDMNDQNKILKDENSNQETKIKVLEEKIALLNSDSTVQELTLKIEKLEAESIKIKAIKFDEMMKNKSIHVNNNSDWPLLTSSNQQRQDVRNSLSLVNQNKNNNKKEPNFTLIVEPKTNWKPKDGNQTKEYVNGILQLANKSKELKPKYVNCKTISQKRVIYECESAQHVSVIRDILKESDQVAIKETKKKLPRIMVVGIPLHLNIEYNEQMTTEQRKNAKFDSIEKEIYSNNDSIKAIQGSQPNEKILVKFAKNDRKGTQYAIIDCTGAIFKEMIQLGGIYIGAKFCPLQERISVTQCFRCQRYGHIAEHCPNNPLNKMTCAKCCDDHETTNCPNKDITKCINCKWFNESTKVGKMNPININHRADDHAHCPQFSHMEGIIRRSIDYRL